MFYTNPRTAVPSPMLLPVRKSVLLVIILLCTALIPGCALFPKEEKVLAPPLIQPSDYEYDLAAVERGTIDDSILGIGTIVYPEVKTLSIAFSGSRLKGIYVKRNQKVAKGQLVAELENDSLLEAVRQIEDELTEKQLQMQLFELDMSLVSGDGIDKDAQYQKYLINKRTIEINIELLQERLAKAQKEYEKSFVRSPVDGMVVYKTAIKDGEYIPSMETLFQVQEQGTWAISNIYSITGGKLKAIYVDPGASVIKGDLLGELENEDLAFTVKEIEAQLESAQLSLQLFELEMRSLSEGVENTDTQYQKYLINKQLRQMDLDKTKERLAKAREEYEKTLLISDYDAIVTMIADLEEGQIINAYNTIVQISDTSTLLVNWILPSHVSNPQVIRHGAKVTLTIKDVEFTGTIVATPADYINEKDREKFSKQVMIEVEDLPADIEAGTHASIVYLLERKENTLIIPQNALRSISGKEFVYILDGEYKRERLVETGISTRTEVEILKGLEEGEMVIID